MITLAKIHFLLFLNLRLQVFSKNFLFSNTPLQETIDIAINLIFNHNRRLNITRKDLKKTFAFYYIIDSSNVFRTP